MATGLFSSPQRTRCCNQQSVYCARLHLTENQNRGRDPPSRLWLIGYPQQHRVTPNGVSFGTRRTGDNRPEPRQRNHDRVLHCPVRSTQIPLRDPDRAKYFR
jgi:hypothetical protein